MRRKTYDRIKRWSKRHGGAYYTNGGEALFLEWDETDAMTWAEVVAWFNAARARNTAAVTVPK